MIINLLAGFLLFLPVFACKKDDSLPQVVSDGGQAAEQFFNERPLPVVTSVDTGDTLQTNEAAATVKIELALQETELLIGQSARLRINAVDVNNRKREVTDESEITVSPSSILGVNADLTGYIIGLGVGVGAVSVTYQGYSASTVIRVSDLAIQSYQISPAVAVVGSNQKFAVVALLVDATTRDLTTSCQWSTDEPHILEQIADSSVFKVRIKGQTTVRAKCGGDEASKLVEARLKDIAGISLSSESEVMQLASTMQMIATVQYMSGETADITGSVEWESLTPDIAQIENSFEKKGKLTAVNGGVATIKASVGSVSATYQLEVQTTQFASFQIQPDILVIPKGGTAMARLIGVFANQTTQDITDDAVWASDNHGVVTVSNAEDEVGKITAWEVGAAVISAVFGKDTISHHVTVTEAALTKLVVKSESESAACGVVNPRYTAEGEYSDGTKVDMSELVTWQVMNTNIAIVSNAKGSKGIVTTIRQGSTTVKATFFESRLNKVVEATLPLIVTAPGLQGYTITASKNIIPVGATLQLSARGVYTCEVNPPVDVTNTVNWSISSNPYATVKNSSPGKGLVSTSGETSANTPVKVEVGLNGIKGSIDLTVAPKELVSVQIFSITGQPIVDVDRTLQMRAEGVFTNNTRALMTSTDMVPGYRTVWSTLDPSRFIVDDELSQGLITGVSEGSALVRAMVQTPTGLEIFGTLSVSVESPCFSGIKQQRYCWFLGQLNESCEELCLRLGHIYVPGEIDVVGSQGNRNSCQSILTSVTGSGSVSDDRTAADGQGVGCGIYEVAGLQSPRRYTNPSTTGDAKSTNIRRLCSCRDYGS